MNRAAGEPLRPWSSTWVAAGLRSLRLTSLIAASFVAIREGFQLFPALATRSEGLDILVLAFATLGGALVWSLTKASEGWLRKNVCREFPRSVGTLWFENDGVAPKNAATLDAALAVRRWHPGRGPVAVFGISAVLLVGIAALSGSQPVVAHARSPEVLGAESAAPVSVPDGPDGVEIALPPPLVTRVLELGAQCHLAGRTDAACILYAGYSSTLELGTFRDSSEDARHVALVDWGDGTMIEGVIDEDHGTVMGSHAYTTPGLYEVRVTVGSSTGEWMSASMPIGVVSIHQHKLEPPAEPADERGSGHAPALRFSRRVGSHYVTAEVPGGWRLATESPV